MEKPKKLVTGPRILIALVVLAATVVILARLLTTTKTTIRITKGRPGVSTIWNVEIESGFSATTRVTLQPGVAVSGEVWRRMGGKIKSFREIACDGTETSVRVFKYQTQAGGDKPNDVYLTGEVSSPIKWDFDECLPTAQECTFPDRYFDPTYYEDPAKACPDDPNAIGGWRIVLY